MLVKNEKVASKNKETAYLSMKNVNKPKRSSFDTNYREKKQC